MNISTAGIHLNGRSALCVVNKIYNNNIINIIYLYIIRKHIINIFYMVKHTERKPTFKNNLSHSSKLQQFYR